MHNYYNNRVIAFRRNFLQNNYLIYLGVFDEQHLHN